MKVAGFAGYSGAGKTTLFNCLSGALQPSGGRVVLAGQDVTGRRADAMFQAGLARTFQIPRPFPEMTVLDNVLLATASWLLPGPFLSSISTLIRAGALAVPLP